MLSNDQLLALWQEMKRIRVLDTFLLQMQRQGRIGFYGPCQGQEAVPVAAALALTPLDWVVPALREGPLLLLRGLSLSRFFAQLLGNKFDNLKGRQMPSHASDRSLRCVSWSSCVGTQLPHAVGLAWATKHHREAHAVLAFLGDGATSTADFHSAMNFAGVFRLPVVFVCQNNQWAISTPVRQQTQSDGLAIKATAYGMPGVTVNGNDVAACFSVLDEALTRARAGQGPTLVECVTYRTGPHSSSDDPGAYQPAGEVRSWMQHDPIASLATQLREQGVCTDPSIGNDRGEQSFERQIVRTFAQVEQEALMLRETLFDDVYAKLPWHLREQKEALLGLASEPNLSYDAFSLLKATKR